MDMVWECYSKMMYNNDPAFNRVLYYASRDGYKTLGASILELLVVFHLGRDVAHMAAIEAQSEKSQLYVKNVPTAVAVSVGRGHMGTTAASHANAASLAIQPAFADVEYLDALNAALDASFPFLYQRVQFFL